MILAEGFHLGAQVPVNKNFLLCIAHELFDFQGLTAEHAVIAATFCKMIYDMWTMEDVP